MAVQALLLVALAVAVAWGLLRYFPDETMAALRFINTSRALVFGVLLLSTALVFIASGSPLLIVAGMAILVFLVVQILVDGVHTRVLEMVGL